MTGLKHITNETLEFLSGGKENYIGVQCLSRPGPASQQNFYAPCGWGGSTYNNVTWSRESSGWEGFTAIDIHSKEIKIGYSKVTCPKCIAALKRRGL